MNTYGMLSLKLHWRNLSDSQQTFSSCALKLETGLNDLIFHKSQLLVTARISMSLLTLKGLPLLHSTANIEETSTVRQVVQRHRRAVFLTKSRKRVTQPDWRMVTYLEQRCANPRASKLGADYIL